MTEPSKPFETIADAAAWLTREADRLERRAGSMARLAGDYDRFGLGAEAELARFSARSCRIDSIADRAFAATLLTR